jgi:hypothetical protein
MPVAAERFRSRAQVAVIVAPQAVKIEAVSKVSNTQKLGVVARVAGQQARRSRTVRALGGAISAVGRSLGRVLHQLWLEVMGLLFLLMAFSGGVFLAREYAEYHARHTALWHVVIAICFTVTFAWFGVSSFWRARQKSKGSR